MPAANAEGWSESEGGIAEVSARRVARYPSDRYRPSALAVGMIRKEVRNVCRRPQGIARGSGIDQDPKACAHTCLYACLYKYLCTCRCTAIDGEGIRRTPYFAYYFTLPLTLLHAADCTLCAAAAHAACSCCTLHAARCTLHAARSTQHAARNTQHAACHAA